MKFSEMNTNARLEHDKIVNRYKDVPECYDGMKQIETKDVEGAFNVLRYHVVTKNDMVKNKDTNKWEVRTSKAGKPLTITLAYVMCRNLQDEVFYFVTKSPQMLSQLWTDDGKKTEYDGRNGRVTVFDMDEGIEDLLEIRTVKVEYKDGKKYDQPLLGVVGE